MMGLKLAKALGSSEVVAFTTSPNKVDAAKAAGATKVCVTTDPKSVEVRQMINS